jgi:hypothetical protein
MEYVGLRDDARANIRADTLAKTTSVGKTPIPNPVRLPEEDITVVVGGNKLQGKVLGSIWSSKYKTKLRDYWRKKGRFQNEEGVDWEVIEQANKKVQPKDRKMITKLLSGWVGTAEKMHQRGEFANAACPICNQCREDRRHLWRCPDQRMNWKLTQEMYLLKDLLRKPIYETELFPAVEALIDMYRFESDTYIQKLSERNQELVMLQREIGVHSFVEGILHKNWRKYCGGTTGVIVLIRRLYKIWIELWKNRNDIFKGDGIDWKTAERIREDILQLMEERPRRLNGDDKNHFDIEVDMLVRRPIDEQRYWIQGSQAIIKKMKKIHKGGILRYTMENSLIDTQRYKDLARQSRLRRKEIRDKEIRRMIRWKPSRVSQDEMRIIDQGDNILRQDDWTQLRWLRQMQKVKKNYNERWHSRSNLEEWKLKSKSTDTTKMEEDRRNSTVEKRTKKKQSRITTWLVRESSVDEG